MASTKPVIAFYGATGGCTLAALVETLDAGYDCTALARTPSKLTNLLLERNIPQSTLDTHLTVHQGDALSIDACRLPLTLRNRTVDIIVTGIGLPPSQHTPGMSVCTDAASNTLSALSDLHTPTKPLFVAISTTGIDVHKRDVPYVFFPLYHWFLKNPHADKRNMEAAIEAHALGTASAIRGYVMVRPSLLTNGKAHGGSHIRVGDERKPAIGYTISRDDVGLWVFESLVKGDAGRFVGHKPTITY